VVAVRRAAQCKEDEEGLVRQPQAARPARRRWRRLYRPNDESGAREPHLLSDIVRVDPPILCKGKLALWTVPDGIVRELERRGIRATA
jgi:hypothetical protein